MVFHAFHWYPATTPVPLKPQAKVCSIRRPSPLTNTRKGKKEKSKKTLTAPDFVSPNMMGSKMERKRQEAYLKLDKRRHRPAVTRAD